MISVHSQNALLSLGNPLQTLKRMSELIGLLCAQLDVLCRRNEESIGPATTVAVVSKAKQSNLLQFIAMQCKAKISTIPLCIIQIYLIFSLSYMIATSPHLFHFLSFFLNFFSLSSHFPLRIILR